MTKHEAAIIQAYTGVVMLQGDDLNCYYRYVQDDLGIPIIDLFLASKEYEERVKAAAKPDFIKLCEEVTDDEVN